MRIFRESKEKLILYHLTTHQNYRLIKRKGIVPNNKYRKFIDTSSKEGRVYLTKDPKGKTVSGVRMSRILSPDENNIDTILKVDVSGLTLYNDTEGEKGVDYYVTETISPSRIIDVEFERDDQHNSYYEKPDDSIENKSIDELKRSYKKLIKLNAPEQVLRIYRQLIIKKQRGEL